MSYIVKELFATLQGEGGQSGRASVFCRFAGCNLWLGREADRATASCRFCDTDFVGGVRYGDAHALASAITAAWPGGDGRRYVVFTGGEPMLQLDRALLDAVHAHRFEAAIEYPVILRASTVPLEIAHLGQDGVMHGHSLLIEAWTDHPVDLDVWRDRMNDATTRFEGQLERTIGGRTFEDVAEAVLAALPECVRVTVRLPTRGHVVEAVRTLSAPE